jgi:hypothetical protein
MKIGGRSVVGFGGQSVGLGDASLPSGDAAIRLMRGDYGAVVDVVSTMLLRSTLVAGGLAIAGLRGVPLLKNTAAATAAVEAGVLVLAWHNKDK